MKKAISTILLEFETFLKLNNIPVLDRLEEGINKEKISELLNAIKIQDESLFEIYQWRNGTVNFGKRTISELEIFPEGIMLSVEDAFQCYNMYVKQEKIWSEHFFPIFTNGGGDYYVIDLSTENEKPVYLYAPSLLLSELPQINYASLKSLFLSVQSCYEKGAYTYNKVENAIDIDYDLRQEICKQFNPGIEFWE